VLKAEDFKIVGDGKTDNSAALMAIRDQIRAGKDRVWHVDFEPGHYCYADNRWAMFGDRSVVLEFNHSTLECFADADRPSGTYTPISGTGWHVAFENCAAAPETVCWPTVAKRNDFIDCRLGCAQVEMDKIVESVRFNRCEIRNWLSSGGASVLDVSFRDCNFYGFVQATPRRSWIMDGCHFYNGVHLRAGLTNTPFALTSTASAV
jgi:hypothetical protein